MKRGRRGAYDWRQTISRTTSHIQTERDATNVWHTGTVATPLGYVMVYSEKDWSDFRAIVNGMEYSYSVRRGYTVRGLATVAARFIARLHEEVG